MKRLVCLLLCLCLLLAGCSADPGSPAETESQPTEPTEEPVEETDAPSTDPFGLAYIEAYGLNPYDCMCLTNRPIISLLYEGLFALNNRFEPEPVLCDKLAVSDNGKTYALTLCEGVCFSDGSALTAQDVVASLNAAKASDYYGARFYQVAEFSAKDERTVTIWLNTVYENLPLLLDVPIVKAGTENDDVPIGSGPYRTDVRGLVKNRNWWQSAEAPLTQNRITLSRLGTPTEVRDDFEFGATTLVCADLNTPSAVGYRCDYELWDCPTTTMQYLGFNLSAGICANPTFRAAITHLMDRESYIASIYKGFGEAAYLPCSPSSPLYDSKLAENYAYDRPAFAAAKRESGIGKGYTGTILVCSADSTRVELAHRISEDFSIYGIELTVNAVDSDTYRRYMGIGNFDMFIGETRLSANFDLTEFFRPYGSLNYGGLTNRQLQQLCVDALENSGNYYELHKVIMDNGYICPLLFKSYAVMVSRGAISNLQSAGDNVFHLPGGRTLADATVPYEQLVPSPTEAETE